MRGRSPGRDQAALEGGTGAKLGRGEAGGGGCAFGKGRGGQEEVGRGLKQGGGGRGEQRLLGHPKDR